MTTNTYLNFNGNTEEAFNFYRSVFGGEFATIMRFKDVPPGAGMPPEEQNMVMHVALPIGSSMLMGTDAVKSMGQSVAAGTNSSIIVSTDTRQEADKFFHGISQGGKVTVPLADMFWGDYFGAVTDKFGVQWMISHRAQNQQ